jgi:hypothetical protein
VSGSGVNPVDVLITRVELDTDAQGLGFSDDLLGKHRRRKHVRRPRNEQL